MDWVLSSKFSPVAYLFKVLNEADIFFIILFVSSFDSNVESIFVTVALMLFESSEEILDF